MAGSPKGQITIPVAALKDHVTRRRPRLRRYSTMRPKGSRARPSTKPLKGIWPRSAYLDRIIPSRRERTVNFALPPIEKAADIVAATAALASAVAKGELTPGESAAF